MNNNNQKPPAGEGSADAARYPALPGGMTRDEAIEGLREIASMAAEHQRETDPSFVRWPDLDAMLDYLEVNGFPPPDNAIAQRPADENEPKTTP